MTQFGSPSRWPGSQKLMLDPVRTAVEVRAGAIVAAVPALGGILRRPSADTWLNAEMIVMLDAGNIETGDPRWNERLRSLGVSGNGNPPQIRFVGSVVPAPTNLQLELRGSLEFQRQIIPLAMEVRCRGERAGAFRLPAQGMLTPEADATSCNVCAGEGDVDTPGRMKIVIHAEWIETCDPMPAA